MHEFLRTPWEKYCTPDNAKRTLEDTETIVEEIDKAAGITDKFPFSFGMQFSSATLLPEEQNHNNST